MDLGSCVEMGEVVRVWISVGGKVRSMRYLFDILVEGLVGIRVVGCESLEFWREV